MEEIWWRQIPKAHQFRRAITDSLLNDRSVILSIPATIPWWQTLYGLVEESLSLEDPCNRMQMISCPQEEVGEYLFFHYCEQEKRAGYRRGVSYAAFLAQSEGLVLNNRYLWVRDVRGGKLEEWTRFITEYNKNFPPNRPHARFLLETPEEEGHRRKAVKGLQRLVFSECVDEYDYFAFCALASTGASVTPALRTYLAELCATLCGKDAELCAACITRGQRFLEEPEKTLREIADDGVRSDGTRFDIRLAGSDVQELIWKSQIRTLFPILQQYRSDFVRRYREKIAASLPITNSFGEVIDDPQDVELGLLVLLVARQCLFISGEEYERLKLFRDARNSLAHMRPVDFSAASEILSACF